MSFVQELASRYPLLHKKLATAHISETPEAYVRRNLVSAAMITGIFTFASAMLILGFGKSPLWIPVALIVGALGSFQLFMARADIKIRKMAKDIDRDVLFAGRFLLIKLNSGRPLINAITDASNSYGVANHYFKEIAREIDMGTPLEQALENASRYSPSARMQRILFQISNALKIGIDVTNYLEAILDEIAEEQLMEIKNYGHKLASITLFYMLFAIVIPSLGITMFIVAASLINIKVDFMLFIVFLFMLIIIEFVFITIFRQIRPNVNI
jgi:pilus assembly protein TadC